MQQNKSNTLLSYSAKKVEKLYLFMGPADKKTGQRYKATVIRGRYGVLAGTVT
jgi:hypothetical protein